MKDCTDLFMMFEVAMNPLKFGMQTLNSYVKRLVPVDFFFKQGEKSWNPPINQSNKQLIQMKPIIQPTNQTNKTDKQTKNNQTNKRTNKNQSTLSPY